MSGVGEIPENELAIEDYAFLADEARYLDEQRPLDILRKSAIELAIEYLSRRSADQADDLDAQSPAKILHRAPLIDPIDQTEKKRTFDELVKSMDACTLDDLHIGIVKKLLVWDPKRKALVPSRFCSFHLGDFNLDEKSTVPLGPPYEPNLSLQRKSLSEYATAEEHIEKADSAFNVISLRVVRVGPDHTYPVYVYGKVIARDEVDHKCVILFEREMKDAQRIRSENDMLALTGPYRALVTLGWLYFEFDLKIKTEHYGEVPFSQGVIPYYYNPFDKRIILQLPSFQSTVKLVLQRVTLPVAASIEVSVVNEGQDATNGHFDGKITAGTTKNYRHHMVLYDGSVPSSGGVVGGNCSLALNRNLVSVKGYVEEPALKEEEKLALYVCFLDAGCEIEDEDYWSLEYEDEDDDDEEEEEEEEEQQPEQDEEEQKQEEDEEEQKQEEDEEEEEQDEEEEEEDEEEEEQDEEDPKNVATLKYPSRETVLDHGSHKLKVKVDWTVVHEPPNRTDFFHRYSLLPEGYTAPNYRFGGFFE